VELHSRAKLEDNLLPVVLDLPALRQVGLKARRQSEGWVLDGDKAMVLHGGSADTSRPFEPLGTALIPFRGISARRKRRMSLLRRHIATTLSRSAC
jgi:hypothetical protein